ncbi:hypothetical protein SAMN02746041_00655 [Desulfacinum hydrothermale DSM 13146]|uniref:Uncharacterized protein n=1 Tax=Desulfacinum hydrothermale DSM 13146 TaxID=1121390 RepID=A0A1W1X696_9BACT|nr:hypothetical protein SAMN02746041_00655 [Desulfacinum hydrothermale DSM 13146]
MVEQEKSEGLASLFSSLEETPEEAPSDPTPEDAEKESASEKIPTDDEPAEPTSPAPNPSRKILGATIAVVALVMAMGFWIFLRSPEQQPAAAFREPRGVQRITQPVSVPEYQEDIRFFFPAQSAQRTDLLSLTVRIRLVGPRAPELFKDLSIPLRREIYHYLSKQSPEKNAHRDWSRIVEGPLLDLLRDRFSTMKIASLELVDLQRI